MLPNDALLTKQGPLARVWLAAHWERKLSKSQLLQTSIPTSVDTIVGDEDEETPPVALRLSGHLLLGIVRIYSRKAKYLEDDCTDALLRIQVAFRNTSTVVDLTRDQLHLAKSAITLPDTLSLADLLMPEPAMHAWSVPEVSVSHSRHSARAADITLPESHYASLDEDIPLDRDQLLADQLPELDTSGHFDLGLEYDTSSAPTPKRQREWRPRTSERKSVTQDGSSHRNLPGDVSVGADDSFASVGVGRDASTALPSAADHVRALVGDVDLSMDFSMDTALEPMALDTTLPPLQASTPPRERAKTPVRDVTFHDAIAASAPLTPRTAGKLRKMAMTHAETLPPKGTRKRAIQDSVTNIGHSHVLQLRNAAASTSTSPHEQRCLPTSRTQLAILTAPKDFARDTQANLRTAFGTALVKFDASWAGAAAQASRREHAASSHTEMQQWLREVHEQSQRLSLEEAEFPAEVGRRASDAPWLTEEVRPGDVSTASLRSMGDTTAGDKSLPPADFSMGDLPELPPLDAAPAPHPASTEAPMDVDTATDLRRSTRRRETNAEVTGQLPEVRLGTPEAEAGTWAPAPVSATQPLAAFEARAQEQPTDPSLAHWDASTLQAMHILRSTMHDDQTKLSDVSQKASRRAAAGFFFELLVLGTKDCVRLQQEEPYGDVTVIAKPALYTTV